MQVSSPAGDAVAGAAPIFALRIRSAAASILILALSLVSAAAMRGVFSPIQELAKADLHLTDFQISLVQGLAASIPIAILAIPLGRLVDRANRVMILVALAVTWTAGSLLTVAAPNFVALFGARMLAGVGAVCAVPVVISMVADLSDPARRGRALMLLSLGQMTGGAAAFALGGWLLGMLEGSGSIAGLAPWRGVHLVFAAISAVLLLPLVALGEPVRREIGLQVHASFRPALRAIWDRRRFLIPLFLGQVTVVMADTAAAIWAAPVLMRDYGQQPAEFGGWMGAVVLLSGIAGSLLGGVAADLSHRSRLKGGILLGAVIAALCSIPGAFFPVMPTATGFAVMLAIMLTCGAVTGLVTATAIALLVPNEIRGVCLGAFIVVGSIIGLGIAPTLVTLVSDALGGESFIRYALTAAGLVTSSIAAIGFIWAMRTAPKGLA